MCFTIRHGKRLAETLKFPSRKLKGLGQRLGSCNVSSRSRLRRSRAHPGGGLKMCVLQRKTGRISETVKDMAKVATND